MRLCRLDLGGEDFDWSKHWLLIHITLSTVGDSMHVVSNVVTVLTVAINDEQ